ncbi:DUF547 domain-containing protein [Flagellimonas allohymeniacidonis]|uniref:DUF547 domain-containing protein n=1 Tax=Flagellimonas allohymeniacidonis TaxID=2517819 RepID=A0A4Q8QCC0_9FLAO|nr:DUF547 domain-containing protein [Allomuricauda hymeniacidonis]TAI48015.1 DUF547 domain-containing protein [Allomuricauda hymeniacidonis]
MKKSRKISVVIAALLLFNFGFAQDTKDFFAKADTFFNTYVKNGRVAYKDIKVNPATLNELLDLAKNIQVSADDPKTYQAFWINGYNLFVIKGIVDNYPIKSPLDKAGFFDKTRYEIGGKKTTLNDIENKLLRAKFPKEARFHFVLVCAGLGCPPIINSAYVPEKLEVQLQKQTELSLNNPKFIRVSGKKVGLSQIFEWYKGDFTQNGKSLVDFVNDFRQEKIETNAKVGYYPYDWNLNESK